MKIVFAIKSFLIFIGLITMYIVFTIVIPFIVQERLMILLTFIFLILTIFNGKISSNEKIIYRLIIKK